MGKDLDCKMQYRGLAHAGRVYLETDFLLFRGDLRLKILFGQMTSVESLNGWLRIGFAGEEARFEIGDYAAKWVDKILHPPSRTAKLGIQNGMRVLLPGKLADDFLEDLEKAGAERVTKNPELVFMAAQKSADLNKLPHLKEKLQPKSALWIIYPKGIDAIRETDVIGTGRSNGLKDTKVVAFSKTHTALRFIRC